MAQTTNWQFSIDGLTASRTLASGAFESRQVSAIPANELALATPASLVDLQADKIQVLTTAYETAIQLPVSYLTTTFQADADSQLVLTKTLSAGSVPTGFFWMDSLNNQVPMTFTQLKGLAAAMLTQGQTAFANLQVKKTAVRAATTASAVAAVVW